MPDTSLTPDSDPQIQQDVTGDRNLVIGQMLGGTVSFTPPIQKPTGTPSNLPRSGVVQFVGRDQKLIDLHAQLQQNDRIAITAIAGMGGIGKTELALQYAIAQLQHQTYPAGFCWLTCRAQEIATQIVSFAKTKLLLAIPDDLEAKEQVDLIWQRWPAGNALIVLDDVTDYNAIALYLPPPDPRFKVLITTRQNFGASVTTINIEELSDEAAIALLKSIVGDERIEAQQEDAQALCKWVGNLPLGLELLGRFLVGKPDWAIAKLLERLESKRLAAKALIETESGMTATLGVAAALELSWAELSQPEQDLACLLGMFAVAPIPWSLVEPCFPEVDSDDLEDWRDKGLRDRSLIKRVGEGTYQLHQIVQEYFRFKLQSYSQQTSHLKTSFFKTLVKISESIQETPSAQEITDIESSITHIEELAIHWVYELDEDDLIWPYNGLSRFYAGKGLFAIAEKWARRCIESINVKCGEESLAYAMSLNNLAIQNITQGHLEEAESNFIKAYELSKDDPRLKEGNNKILNNLAQIYLNKGRYQKALDLHQIVLTDRTQNFYQSQPDIALSLNNIGRIYNEINRHEEAESKLKEALKILELFPNENRLIATCIENLGIAYLRQGRIDDAKTNFLQSLQMNESYLGERHPDVVYSLTNLAACLEEEDNYLEAKKTLHRALEISQDHEHVNNSDLLNLLGEIYKKLKDYFKSEKYLKQVIEVARKYYKSEHKDIAVYLNNLAGLYVKTKEYKQAENVYFESIQIKRNIFGDRSIEVAIGLNNLAHLYYESKEISKAKSFFEEAFQIFATEYGDTHPQSAQISENLIKTKTLCEKYNKKRKKKSKPQGMGFGAK
ncbi:tetratricopeptide repeat protein [Altericista sp. CCNU0014]|uniref:tetratricopeptide repeat protein n=1 Tax=Altericista sp. CCNU0014 TaxID=3082949 RepID=UPI00384B62A0